MRAIYGHPRRSSVVQRRWSVDFAFTVDRRATPRKCRVSMEWFWWDWSLSQWPTVSLQCYYTVGWVIWPVKIVPEMTNKVSSGTLSLYSLLIVECPWHSMGQFARWIKLDWIIKPQSILSTWGTRLSGLRGEWRWEPDSNRIISMVSVRQLYCSWTIVVEPCFSYHDHAFLYPLGQRAVVRTFCAFLSCSRVHFI